MEFALRNRQADFCRLTWRARLDCGRRANIRQRTVLIETTKEYPQDRPVAFMHESRIMRAVVAASSLIARVPIRSFTLSDFENAFDFLTVPRIQREEMKTTIEQFHKQLSENNN